MKRTVAIVGIVLGLLGACHAQEAEQYGKGILPAGSYDFSQVGAVNLANGNLVLDIPLLSYKQRGSLPDLTISLVSNTTTWIWETTDEPDGTEFYSWAPLTNEQLQADAGPLAWSSSGISYAVSGMYTDLPYTFLMQQNGAEPGSEANVTYDMVYDQYGTPHLAGNLPASEGTGTETLDGTGLHSNESGVVLDKQGVSYEPYYCSNVNSDGFCTQTAGVIQDLNGNQIQFGYGSGAAGEPTTLTDSVGRQIPFFDTEDLSAGCQTLVFPGPQSQNGQSPLTVCRSAHAIATDFQYLTTQEYTGTWYLIDSVQLPNGTEWTFTYDTYGNIASIGFPTGGSVSYQWQAVGSCIDPVNRMSQVTSRTLSDGTHSYVWNYTYSSTPSGSAYTAVTDPNGNGTLHLFNGASCVGAPEIETDYFAGAYSIPTYSGQCSGQPVATGLRKSELTSYINEGGINLADFGSMGLPQSKTTVWPNGQTSETAYTYDFSQTWTDPNDALVNAPTLTQNFTTGSVLSQTAYDYGQCAAGPVLQKKQTQYEWQSTSSYLTANLLALPGTVTISNASGSTAAETSYNYNASTGNLTSTTQMTGTSEPAVTTSAAYNTQGMVTSTTDANQNQTAITYQCNGVFPYKVTNPLSQVTTYGYDCNTGLLTSVQNPNDAAANRPGTTYTYTSVGDLQSISYPDGGSVTENYNNYATPLNVTVTTAAAPDPPVVVNTVYDGLGRKTQTQVTSDPAGTDYTDTTYDRLGRVYSVSNPYRSTGDPTYGITSYWYDALGRMKYLCQPDNGSNNPCQPGASYQEWDYTGNTVDFYDETRRHWQRTSDGLGRLTAVLEPGSGNTPTIATSYSYDANSNLTGVSQTGTSGDTPRAARTFSYDYLSRLLSATNPESGTTTYTYDGNGNVLSKTDARGITTSYTNYDALNRPMGKSYSDGTPSVSYSYDTSSAGGTQNTIGMLTGETVSAGSQVLAQELPYAYDPMGRLQGEAECTPVNCGGTPSALAYTYDLAGKMSQVGISPNPGSTTNQAVQLSYAYDGAGNLTTLGSNWNPDAQHPATLFSAMSTASVFAYSPAGQLMNANLAINAQTQQPTMTLSRTYDNRLRILSETDGGQQATAGTAATGSIQVSGTEQTLQGTATVATGTINLTFTEGDDEVKPLFVPSATITLPGGFKLTFGTEIASANSVANDIASALNGDSASPVTAVVDAGAAYNVAAVTLTSKATGSDQNGAIGLTLVDGVVAAPASMTGGTDATIYDAGSVTATINGTGISVNYGQASTSQSIASALASAINSAAAGVTATASASAVDLTASQAGTAGNSITVSVSSETSESGDFSSPSFSLSSTGLSGGTAGSSTGGTIYSYVVPPAAANVGYDHNGNLLSYTDSVTGQWNFMYDYTNRVSAGSATAGPYASLNMGWTYDSFGNRLTQTLSGTPSAPVPQPQAAVYSANNQMSADSYDAAGNVTNDGSNQYAYDGEGRLCAVYDSLIGSYTGYLYDGEGRRVAKGAITSLSCDMSSNGFTVSNSYVLGQSGEQVSELDGSGNFIHTNVFAGGSLLATYYGTTTTYFAFNDWLGTRRLEANPDGSVAASFLSLPFGDSLTTIGGPDATEHHFTGKERDTESGNDYFGARYYANSTGRFLSPDPIISTPLHLLNPQRWNKYAYVINNPLSLTDPNGLDAIAVNFSNEIPIVGHEGIMSVDPDGTVVYARFGPAEGGSSMGAGQVQSFTLNTKIQFDSNGQPTANSLNAVKKELATSGPEKGQDLNSIRLNYFKTTDAETANLDQWIKQQQDVSNRGQSPRYNVLTNNCTMFCQRGLVAGGVLSQSQANQSFIVPNMFWYQLNETQVQEPNATVTVSACDTLPDGSQNCY